MIPSTSSTALLSFAPAITLPSKNHSVQNRRVVLEKCLGLSLANGRNRTGVCLVRRRRREYGIVASGNVAATFWDGWKPENRPVAPSLSDIAWPSAGAFAAMAILGKMDQVLAPRGISMTIAPLGAVCAVLFATPSSPAARKYNMFVAQIGCAAIGVLALSTFGPGWLARSIALAASIAFMSYSGAFHPPAASLPIMFIDGAKFHPLNFWYALFPGAAACILLCFIIAYCKGVVDLMGIINPPQKHILQILNPENGP
ncbi:hypothetical protein CJ030_MR4G020908 [Morella rubra]|uniref:HPP transmembrane region domain-containing protein n=1 Tax=Morella rubra TaxID=262757 RepID=A0A6A1VXD9_9ROSI|nr:hypothetical protein CJ030_MR4G020908 [Morella rubra]